MLLRLYKISKQSEVILTNECGQLADICTTHLIRAQKIVGEYGEDVGEEHSHKMRQSGQEASLKRSRQCVILLTYKIY